MRAPEKNLISADLHSWRKKLRCEIASFFQQSRCIPANRSKRTLGFEGLECRAMMAVDADDAISEAIFLGTASSTLVPVSESISIDIDVDMYRFNATAGQVVDFDIDTTANKSGGLNSIIRLFNAQGTQLAFSDDAAAPGENSIGLDAYLRYTFTTAGAYYIGVSNSNNTSYDPLTGNGDAAGGADAMGSYQLTVQALPIDSDDALVEANSLGAITSTPFTKDTSIATDIDVDLYRFSVTAGQTIDFDIDTPIKLRTSGLGSYLRLFNSQGAQIDFNNDAAAPGEAVTLDSYLRYTFVSSGNYYLGVSNSNNTIYDPTTGNSDTAGGPSSIGSYQLTIQATTAIPTDSDDSIREATTLGVVSTTPISVSSSISPDVDVDMYRFLVTANQVVDFDVDTVLNGTGGLGSYLRIFDSQGVQIATASATAAPGENGVGIDAYLRYTFAASGTYFVGVSNKSNSQYEPVTGNNDTSGGLNTTGSYQLTVQALPVDTDDSLTEAPSLGAVSATTITVVGSILPDVDVDIVRFTATAGQIVDFNIDTPSNGPGGANTHLRLFNSQGAQLAFNNDAAATGEYAVSFDSYIRYPFASSGTYYLGISNANNSNYDPVTGNGDTAGGISSVGSYQLSIQAVGALPVDPNDSIRESIFLGNVSTTAISVSNEISLDVDVDMYHFVISAGQVVDFDIDTLINGPGGLRSYMRLFDAQGAQLDFNNDAAAPGESSVGFDSYLRYTFTNSGTYYIGVSNFNNFQYDPISGNGDTAGGKYAIGSYKLTVRAIALPASDIGNTIGTAISLGQVSTTPNLNSENISTNTDVDMYRITVTAGQVVDFDIDTPLNGPGGLGTYVRLFNAQGVQLDFNNDAIAPGETTVGFDAYLRYTFADAGTYYLGVSNYTNKAYDPITGNGLSPGGLYTTGSYRLTVVALPADTNDSLAEATSLGAIGSTPNTIAASIDRDIDVNMYSFTATAGQTIDFDIDTAFNGPGGLNSYIRLFNAQGALLEFNSDAGDPADPSESTVGFDAYVRYTFGTAGTYYLGVSNFNNSLYDPNTGKGDTAGGKYSVGNYQLTVHAIVVPDNDPDDTISEATLLANFFAAQVSVSDSIAVGGDVDIYRFSVMAGQTVDFDIDTTTNGGRGLDSYLRLFDAQGTQLVVNNDGMAPGENSVGFDAYLRHTFTAAGMYFLGVSNKTNAIYDEVAGNGDIAGGSDSTGSYQLTVHALPVDEDDSLSEAKYLGAITSTQIITDASIVTDVDVDMVRFTVEAGQTIDFDIDTSLNGPGGLSSYIRLFNSQGAELAFNSRAAAPGETVGFDSYLRYTFLSTGTYYLGVSNLNNVEYDSITGNGDTAGGLYSIGNYRLTVQAMTNFRPSLGMIFNTSVIPELNGVAIGRLTRMNTDIGLPLTVSVVSSDSTAATVVSSIVIPADSSTANFQVFGVHNTSRGTTSITITATAINFLGDIHSILVTDSDGAWHNSTNPADVDNDGSVTPLDVLLVINYLNNFGPGYVLNGNPPPFLDVDGDDQVTPLDALRVVNQLNSIGNGEGESSISDQWKPHVRESVARRTDLVDSVYTLYGNEFWSDFESNGFSRSRNRRNA